MLWVHIRDYQSFISTDMHTDEDTGYQLLVLRPEIDEWHDDVIKWKHFPRYWSFVRVIHRSPVNSPHKGQWRGALMFSLICVWINDWVNNRKAGDLRRYHAHYDVTVIYLWHIDYITTCRNNHFNQPSEVLPVVCNSAKRNAVVPRNEHDAMR